MIIPGPLCLNCEEKKNTPYPITIDQKSGFICQECYNSNIWAYVGDNLKQVYLLDTILHTKLFNMKKRGR